MHIKIASIISNLNLNTPLIHERKILPKEHDTGRVGGVNMYLYY